MTDVRFVVDRVEEAGRGPTGTWAQRWLPGVCKHERVRCTHGDEIVVRRWRRRACMVCGRSLNGPLPELCFFTDEPHPSIGEHRFQAPETFREEVEPGTRATCVCGGDIEWRLRPMLPFPDVATDRQLARQGAGRWVHVPIHSGTEERATWCPPQQARPRPVDA